MVRQDKRSESCEDDVTWLLTGDMKVRETKGIRGAEVEGIQWKGGGRSVCESEWGMEGGREGGREAGRQAGS